MAVWAAPCHVAAGTASLHGGRWLRAGGTHTTSRQAEESSLPQTPWWQKPFCSPWLRGRGMGTVTAHSPLTLRACLRCTEFTSVGGVMWSEGPETLTTLLRSRVFSGKAGPLTQFTGTLPRHSLEGRWAWVQECPAVCRQVSEESQGKGSLSSLLAPRYSPCPLSP